MAKIKLIPNSLFQRVAVVFLLLLTLLGICQYLVSTYFWNKTAAEIEQRMHWELAERLAGVLEPYFNPILDLDGASQEIVRLSRINPRVDIAVVSTAGEVLFSLRDLAERTPARIDTAPIAAFLAEGEPPALPILGDHLRYQGLQKPFSAAPIRFSGNDAYLYVLLESELSRTYLRAMRDFNFSIGAIIAQSALLLCSLLLGATVFFVLTRRFSRLAQVVDKFAAGDLTARNRDAAGDEIGRLARQFNDMADRIVSDIRRLEDVDRERRELIANVSHDLSGPLSSAQGYLETALRTLTRGSDAREGEFIDAALRNIKRLAGLARDLLELAKLEAPNVKPSCTRFSLGELLEEDLIPSLRPAAAERQISIVLTAAEQSTGVWADPEMIARVMANLMQNAVKYGKDGGRVEIALTAREDKLEIAVKDDGPGIPAENLPRIFDRFYRVQNLSDTRFSGSGLGLAIVRRIVEAHGETISVNSVEGHGTQFRFQLPRSADAGDL